MTDHHDLGALVIALSVLNLIIQLWLWLRSRRRARYRSAAVEPGIVSEARIYAHVTRGLYPEKACQIATEVHSVEVPITITVQ